MRTRDLDVVDTLEEYDRYLWLVELMKRGAYDDAIYAHHPYLIKDVFITGILVAANNALKKVAEVVGAPKDDLQTIQAWIELGTRGLESSWDEATGLWLDFDVRAGEVIRSQNLAGFAPIIAGRFDAERLKRKLEVFDSTAFCGHPQLRWPLPPSTSQLDPAFQPRRYWRGPVWPFVNWFFWWAL